MLDEINVGMIGEALMTVTDEMTARMQGSGSLEVLATPAMIALMEAAACNTLNPYLEEGMTSVGIEVAVRHVSASPVGERIRAEATIIGVEGRRIMFELRAWDERELIGEGSHIRYVIDIERFFSRLRGETD
jgi:fluoroacetyl-CoA thioesterase